MSEQIIRTVDQPQESFWSHARLPRFEPGISALEDREALFNSETLQHPERPCHLLLFACTQSFWLGVIHFRWDSGSEYLTNVFSSQ